MRGKVALVTGAAGFVGKVMRAALVQRGYSIVRNDIVYGTDARDYFRSYPADAPIPFDLVVHLAAIVGGRAMIEGNPLAVAVDLSIDAEMFQWAVRTHQPRVLYFSSSAAYPVALQEAWLGHRLGEDDIDLDDLQSPDQSYGLSKLVGEYQARLAREHGVKVYVARPFSGTGPTQTLDYPVPSIIARAVAREDPLTVWSDAVRDIIHIDDVVAGALAAVEADVDEPFNLCTGEATSFTQLAQMAAWSVGYKPSIEVVGGPAGVEWRVGDPERMLKFFEPTSNAAQTVARMVASRSDSLPS